MKRALLFRSILVVYLLAAFFPAGAIRRASAQVVAEGWNTPINLSKSGAASQPRIVAGQNGSLQVFWWDSFDGLTTVVFSEDQWSEPQPAPIAFDTLKETPSIIADALGWVHAFWLEGGPGGNLWHVEMPVGTTQWSAPQLIAVSVLDFEMSTGKDEGLSVAFIRTEHDDAGPAGIYVIRTRGGGEAWGVGVSVFASIYFRLLTVDQVWLRIAEGGNGEILLAFRDPRQETSLVSLSMDQGITWNTPEPLGQAQDSLTTPWVTILPDGTALRLWQTFGQSACTLMQQSRLKTAEQLDLGWTEPALALEVDLNCPQTDKFWPLDSNAFWLWGEGTNTLSLIAWDLARLQWSKPISQNFSFEDLESERPIDLVDLRAAFNGDRLVVIGADTALNEVWVTTTRSDALDLIYAEPPPWTVPVSFTETGQGAGTPALAMDPDGRAHIVWAQEDSTGKPGRALLYAYWDGSAISAPSEVVRGSGGEIARQPALSIDRQNRLHMVWSGGLTGGILYSRAPAAEAKSTDSWMTPKTLSSDGVASWPQIGVDAAGRIYVAYVVSLNESRGVYLVTSIDGGDTWSIPIRVFDAEAAGWQMVDHPALAVRPDGALYLAWVQASLPGIRPPEGIFYARSLDRGVIWSEPVAMAGADFDWPRLAVTSRQAHLLYTNAEGGAVWHRWSSQDPSSSGEELWSVASRVPGWQGVTPPFGVAVDGDPGGPADSKSTLHLLGSNPALDLPVYSTWNGERWTSVEAFSFGAQVKSQLGAAAATRPQGGVLAVAWLARQEADGSGLNELLFAARTIPTVVVQVVPEQAATPTPIITPSPTPQLTPQPSPTPNLNKVELPEAAPVHPLALSGGAAVLILAGVFITRWLLDRKQS